MASTPDAPKRVSVTHEGVTDDEGKITYNASVLGHPIKTSEAPKQQHTDADQLNYLSKLLLEYRPYVQRFLDGRQKESERIHKVFFLLLGFFGAVTFIAAFLAYFGKISGDAFLFLIGTMVGYVLAFVLETSKVKWPL